MILEQVKNFITNNEYIFTHKPTEVTLNKINIYGHIHDKKVESKYDNSNYLCVSIDRTSFKPMFLKEE